LTGVFSKRPPGNTLRAARSADTFDAPGIQFVSFREGRGYANNPALRVRVDL